MMTSSSNLSRNKKKTLKKHLSRNARLVCTIDMKNKSKERKGIVHCSNAATAEMVETMVHSNSIVLCQQMLNPIRSLLDGMVLNRITILMYTGIDICRGSGVCKWH